MLIPKYGHFLFENSFLILSKENCKKYCYVYFLVIMAAASNTVVGYCSVIVYFFNNQTQKKLTLI